MRRIVVLASSGIMQFFSRGSRTSHVPTLAAVVSQLERPARNSSSEEVAKLLGSASLKDEHAS
jgi:hypothetical protein